MSSQAESLYYRAWLLRYLPDPIRGEFQNVGVIVGGDHGDWAMRRLKDLSHIHADSGAARGLASWLDQLQSKIDAARSDRLQFPGEGLTIVAVERMATRYNGAVQLHDGGAIAPADAAQGANLLFSLMVEREAHAPKHRDTTIIRNELIESLEKMKQRRPYLHVAKRPRLQAAVAEWTFSLAVTGTKDLVLTDVWSFQPQQLRPLTQKAMAMKGFLHSFRETRTVKLEGQEGDEPREIDPHHARVSIVYKEPKTSEQAAELARAEQMWRNLEVELYPSSKQNDLLATI